MKQDPYTNFSLLDSFWFALIFWCSFFLVSVGLYWCQDLKRRLSLLSNQRLVPLTPANTVWASIAHPSRIESASAGIVSLFRCLDQTSPYSTLPIYCWWSHDLTRGVLTPWDPISFNCFKSFAFVGHVFWDFSVDTQVFFDYIFGKSSLNLFYWILLLFGLIYFDLDSSSYLSRISWPPTPLPSFK